MKHCLLTTLFLIFFATAFGLLSPIEQSLAELKALVTDPQMSQLLKTSETILDIRRLETSFVVVTETRQMVVDISYVPQRQPGLQQFKLYFSKPERIRQEVLDK